MTALSPAVLRLGGSPADWTIFADDDSTRYHTNASDIFPVINTFTRKLPPHIDACTILYNLIVAVKSFEPTAPRFVLCCYPPARGNYVFTLVVGSIMSVHVCVCVCVSVPL